jgi:hypothetical protein
MNTPPVKPRALFTNPTVGLRIARTWMVAGSLIALLGLAMSVAHFGYGVAIENNDTGVPATSDEVLLTTALLGGGGLLFVVLGYFLRRKLLGQKRSG